MITIIGEAGSCHEQSLRRALMLTETAAEAGCTYIKWQFWSDPARMRERRHVLDAAAYEAGSIRARWLVPLLEAARDVGLKLMVTAYLSEDVATLDPFVDAFKVASFEAMDRQLLAAILRVRKGRPVYISTGMCTQSDVYDLDHVDLYGETTLLHCVSAYPCPLEAANLGAIRPGDGYSDHTRHSATGGLAVAAGATTLEVHFRLQDTGPGCPDYVVALSPSELREYVEFARHAAKLRGSGEKVPQAAEVDMLPYRVLG